MYLLWSCCRSPTFTCPAADLAYTVCRRELLLELPEDLLWTIMGFLDMRSLCTARVVCKRFCQSASGRLKALMLNSATLEQHPTTTFMQFSGLTRLQVSLQKGSDLHLLGHPRVAPVVSHIRLWRYPSHGSLNPDDLAHLALLPKLRSLCVNGVEVDQGNIGLLPDGLEELMIHAPYWWCNYEGLSDASPLSRFSKLTSLGIGLGEGAGQSVQSLTSLGNLRSLCLNKFSTLGVLSTLTMLTSLTWILDSDDLNRGLMFHDLCRLTGLSKLKVDNRFRGVAREDLACVAQLTGLTCLKLCECRLPDWVPGSSGLSPLTRLVCLGLFGLAGGLPLLAGLNLEEFQSLKLGHVQGDTSVLRRATRLTHLEFSCYRPVSLRGLGATLRRMSDLRSLRLSVDTKPATKSFRLSHALQPLTRLTKLDYTGHFKVDSDMRACASLPSLRCFGLRAPTITPAYLPALQAMSGLTGLGLLSMGTADVSVDDVVEALDAQRLRRGWPRLKRYWWC
jgi:hypothetical protein